MITLGRLEKVDLRDIWKTEAQDFTPWLAREDNLSELADTIKLDLELEAQEKNVGPFRADILCKNTDDGSWVLIENQLERTDHIHLGQLLTYASGLDAVTIVWVAAQFTDEHRATLDWLNDITDDKFRFFGLEVELWRIGDSAVAPKFNVVSKPNDWTRSISRAAKRISEEPVSALKAQQQEYWTALKDFMERRGSPIRSQAPLPQHWAVYGIGRTNFSITATVNTRENRLGVELYIGTNDAKTLFRIVREEKEAVESEIGSPVEWMELPERKGSRIVLFRKNTDPTDEGDWPVQHAWMADTIEKFDRTFRDRVKTLNADDWAGEGEESEPD